MVLVAALYIKDIYLFLPCTLGSYKQTVDKKHGSGKVSNVMLLFFLAAILCF